MNQKILSNNTPRIVHIGFGAFHRGHQLCYGQKLFNQQANDWRYCAVSLFSTKDIIQLKKQAYKFHILEQDQHQQSTLLVDIVEQALHPKLDGVSAITDVIADANTQIISLTVTEKGYCVIPGTNQLDIDNTAIKSDLQNLSEPSSMIGYLIAGLQKRQLSGGQGLTIMSCDNLQGNGEVIKGAILDFAKRYEPSLKSWINDNVCFPSTMVDRMVPAMNVTAYHLLAESVGQSDLCGVVSEPFIQWVIEDNFYSIRPNWQDVGVQIVKDVAPFELIKLRLLNGSHSILAYVGALLGYKTVSDTMQMDAVRWLVTNLMQCEQLPTLELPDNFPVNAYIDSLILRFDNPKLNHKTQQICQDGSQKLPQRFFGAITNNIANNQPYLLLAFGVAAWLRYLQGVDELGQSYQVIDPYIDEISAIYSQNDNLIESAKHILQLPHIFPNALRQHHHFNELVLSACQMIQKKGVCQTLLNLQKSY